MAKVVEVMDIAYTPAPRGTGYHTIRFIDDEGYVLMANVFDRLGFVTVTPVDCRVDLGAVTADIARRDPGVYETELRIVLASRGTRGDLPRGRFRQMAETFGCPEVADWYGQKMNVPVRINGRAFTACYRITGISRNGHGKVIIECRTSKDKERTVRLEHARYYMAGGRGKPAPEVQPRGRALDLEG